MNEWKWLTDHIPRGRAEAISMQHLARIMGTDERELRRSVEQARRAGILICSSNRGYFLPENGQEIREHVHRARERIRTGSVCLRPFIRELIKREADGE